jgi:hypothetical protein
MRTLASIPERRASFREEKRFAVLTVPLTSEGRPAEGVDRRLVLSHAPELRGLVEAVRGTLAGDLPALQRFYSVGLEGPADAWQLTLVPVDKAVQGFVKVVRVKGSEAQVTEVETVEPDGDLARMAVSAGS